MTETCAVCAWDILQVQGGQGPIWVHEPPHAMERDQDHEPTPYLPEVSE